MTNTRSVRDDVDPFAYVTFTEHGAVCVVCGAGLAVLTGPDAPFEHDPDCVHWRDESMTEVRCSACVQPIPDGDGVSVQWEVGTSEVWHQSCYEEELREFYDGIPGFEEMWKSNR